MRISILLLLLLHFVIPIYLFYTLWRSRYESKFDWLLIALIGTVFMAYLFIAGRWDWFSIYLRYLYIVLFAAAAVFSYRRVRQRPFFITNGRRFWQRHGWSLLELVLISGLLIYAVGGFFYTEEPVRLTFPLQDGRYYVAQGGNSQILNAHNSVSAQQYALDITEVNDLGVRTEGLYPTELDKYVIFNETIDSPCDGTVTTAVDGMPDNKPPQTDTENLAGNHVVIACKDVQLLIAHMKNGSVMVQKGDSVTTGQPLGRVGNSGNTTEPHLHIHAVEEEAEDTLAAGDGVPILFNGDFSVRNTIFAQ